MKTEKPALARIAIPAHIYIAVPMTDDSTDEELIAAAKKRISEITGDDCIFTKGFQDDEHAVVYLEQDNEGSREATVEDRNW